MEIGRGAQYKVIDTPDGRVKKIPLSIEESQAVIASWHGTNRAPKSKLPINYIELTKRACRKIKRLIKDYPGIAYTFGNPIFEGEGVYTQDKVPTLGEVLNKSSIAESKLLIDLYIELIIFHWRYGISDVVYNFTVNNGVDNDGRVILLDFGELTSSEAKTRSQITKKRWLHAFSYNQEIPETLKKYYINSMHKRLTTQLLSENWATALNIPKNF
ncbi:MAG: hypothetical protein ABSB12_01790 [Candidatus Saccharimonadales bacterium]|jgi:hypothetical protein